MPIIKNTQVIAKAIALFIQHLKQYVVQLTVERLKLESLGNRGNKNIATMVTLNAILMQKEEP